MPPGGPACAQVYALMERGAAARATGATKLNEISSRSHAIFMLIVEKSTVVSVGGGGGGGGGEEFQGMVVPGECVIKKWWLA